MNNTSFNHVTKDGVFDNVVVQDLKVNQLTGGNWYQGIPATNKFKFDPNFLDPEKTKYFDGGTVGIDRGFAASNNLENVNKFFFNFSNLNGQDLEFIFEQIKVTDSSYYVKPMTLDVVDVNKPEHKGSYYITDVYFNTENDPVTSTTSTFFPFEYRNFSYGYRKVGYVAGTPAMHQVFIYPLRSDGADPPVDDSPYMGYGYYSTRDEDADIYNLYNPDVTLGATSFFMTVFYTKSSAILVRSEMDAFVKRYIDNVIYGDSTSVSVAPIETMRNNFYTNYSAIRGSLNLVENFELVDPDVAGGTGGEGDYGGLYDNIAVGSVTPGSDFKVKISYYNQQYHVAVADGGSGYDATSVGQTFTVLGSDLGVGISPYPAKFDAVIKVTAVSSSGTITGIELVSGEAPCLKAAEIINGGYNIYDETYGGGNKFYTNLYDIGNSEYIPYNYGEIYEETSDEFFGNGSKYCCVYNNSIFSLIVSAPQMMIADEFYMDGTLFGYYLYYENNYKNFGQSVYGDCHQQVPISYTPDDWYLSNQYLIMNVQPISGQGALNDGDILNVSFNFYNDYVIYAFTAANKEQKVSEKRKKHLEKRAARRPTKEEHEKRCAEFKQKNPHKLAEKTKQLSHHTPADSKPQHQQHFPIHTPSHGKIHIKNNTLKPRIRIRSNKKL